MASSAKSMDDSRQGWRARCEQAWYLYLCSTPVICYDTCLRRKRRLQSLRKGHGILESDSSKFSALLGWGRRLLTPSCWVHAVLGMATRVCPGSRHSLWRFRVCVLSCSVLSDSCDPMDCSRQGYSVHGISWREYWNGLPILTLDDFPQAGSNPSLLCLLYWQVDSLPPGKPRRRGDLQASKHVAWVGGCLSGAECSWVGKTALTSGNAV